ncbi:MAG TPA: ABC transporter substrate-binding protein [Methylomirabilota bacterium]|jgi:putative ABC transport system substrate-binding protein
MNRRRFLLSALGIALTTPRAAGAEPAAGRHRVGILSNVPVSNPRGAYLWGEFAKALGDLGYVEGGNLTIDNLSSEGRYDRLPALAAELVRRKVDVIVAPAAQNVLAARQASPTIPIVMVGVGDPIGNGLVASLARPGGNVTGTSFLTSTMVGKQLEILAQIVPPARRLAVLVNPTNPGMGLLLEQATAAGRGLGVQLQRVEARSPADLDGAFTAATREHAGGLFVPWDGMFLVRLRQIVGLAASSRIPALYGERGYVDAGGLACYGPSAVESNRRAASYVDRILKGAKPSELPIEQPTQFELAINLKAARALSLTIPPAVIARADQVID